MKKLLSLLSIILFLVACSTPDTNITTPDTNVTTPDTPARFTSETFFNHRNSKVHTLEDTETSCKYLIVSEYQAGFGTAITPLLKSDGTPNCDK